MYIFQRIEFHVVTVHVARERERVKSAAKASGASCTRPFTYRRCTTCLLAYRVPPRTGEKRKKGC